MREPGLRERRFGRRRYGALDGRRFAAAPSEIERHDFIERYSRHLLLPEVGVAGQSKLQAARVALIGAGGLGSPAAFYLAAAGVGTPSSPTTIAVDRSNLQRQVLHTDARIGDAQAESGRRRALSALNPRTRLEASRERVHRRNVEALIDDHDVVIDGADNFPARYLLNEACVRWAFRWSTARCIVSRGRSACSTPDAIAGRAVLPLPVSGSAVRASAPNCAEAGVLGVLPG